MECLVVERTLCLVALRTIGEHHILSLILVWTNIIILPLLFSGSSSALLVNHLVNDHDVLLDGVCIGQRVSVGHHVLLHRGVRDVTLLLVQ